MNKTNPFKATKERKKRLKIFLYGPYGTKKTRTALSFPVPAVIDTEGSSEIYSDEFTFDVLPTSDPDSILNAVNWLLTNKHKYRTLVIDPITIWYDALQKKWHDIFMAKLKSSKGFKGEFYQLQPGDWRFIKADTKLLFRKLLMLDMNIVITAREKALYSDNEFMKKIGQTFDGEKNMAYEFDTVLRLYTEGNKFMACAEKDRNNKFKTDVPFELSYEAIENAFGKELLNREAEQIQLITDDQKSKMQYYLTLYNLTQEQITERLSSYDATTINELTKDNAEIILSKLVANFDAFNANKNKGEEQTAHKNNREL